MHNKSKIRIIALLLVAVLCVSGISAYFTDADTTTNTFTIGRVSIDLDEPSWVPPEQITPEEEYPKDPQITNDGLNDTYVFVKVIVPYGNVVTSGEGGAREEATDTELFTYVVNDGWVEIGTPVVNEEDGTVSHVYAYSDGSTMTTLTPDSVTNPVFDYIKFVNVVEDQGLEEGVKDVIVNGYAIQTDDIGTNIPEDVWGIIEKQDPELDLPEDETSQPGQPSEPDIEGPEEPEVIPMLAANETWFTQGGTSVARTSITEINIVDSYAPAGEVTDSWDASAEKNGSVMAYVEGSKLTIAGNGSGYVWANPDSSYAFSSTSSSNRFSNLKSVGGSNLLVTNKATNMQSMFNGCSSLVNLNVSGWDVSNVTNLRATFQLCESLTKLDVDEWDVSDVTSLKSTFAGCFALKELDVSDWDVSSVTDMNATFQAAVSLKQLDVSKWDTGSVTTMKNMFLSKPEYGEMALTELDVSDWDVSNVRDMFGMFQLCTSLDGLDVSSWNVANVTSMGYMFNCCESLSELDVSDWNVDNVIDTSYMFNHCESLTSIGDVANWNVANVTDTSYMFNCCGTLTGLDVSDWNVGSVTDMSYMFNSCSSLTELDVSNWDVSNVTNMERMFSGCINLETLDVSDWDVSNVTTMSGMFSCASDYGEIPMKIKELDVSNWDTSSATDMSFMFYGCKGPGFIDVSGWDVSKVTTFDHMFAHAYAIIGDVSNWDTSSATNMNALFHRVQNTKLDLSNFDTSNVFAFSQMFQDCSNLVEIVGLENFDTSSGIDFQEMFLGCVSLRELDLSSFDTRNAQDGILVSGNGGTSKTMNRFFESCRKLEKITLGENFSFNGNGTTESNVAVLPTPYWSNINGANQKWYSLPDGVEYDPADIPNRTAGIYVAVFPEA